MITRVDGTIISSSQVELDAWLADRATPIFHGIILEVRPCDSEKNYSALNAEDFRGYRHECKVLASDYIGREPDIIITNVIIPPGRHSGLDDFDEDLPRGTTGTVDGSHFSDDLRKVDYTKLDGEWCLAPGTKILTADLTWVPIEELKIGQELIGFPEKITKHGRLMPSFVQAKKSLKKKCVRITTTQGELVCSEDHLWVARRACGNLGKHGIREWIRGDQIAPGDLISKFADPWFVDTSYEGGYLAGFLDGEGSIGKPPHRTGIQFGQNPGRVLNYVLKLLKERGFEISQGKNHSQFGSDCVLNRIIGERAALRILGSLRPRRLMKQARHMWEGSRPFSKRTKPGKVLTVEHIGVRKVWGVQTTTRTFIAEGFLSHNCLVGFVGGNIENPVIIGWWPHPANKYDLITSGNKTFGEGLSKTSLAQFDTKTGKSRFLRRVNGTIMMVSKDGSVYLDTSEANSSVKIVNGKYTRTLVDKGGDFQFDLAPKAQFEINFNEKDHKNPRIGARSNSKDPKTDIELPHPDQPVSGEPKPRETSRTYIRGKEYELLLKTSNFSIFCEKVDGGEDGEFIVQAHDGVTIAQQESGGTAATLSIRDGEIQLVANDGTQINALSDEVQLVNKSGSVISLKGTVATVSAATIALAGSVAVSGAMSVSDGNPATSTESALKGESYLDEEETLLKAIKTYLTAMEGAWSALTPAQAAAATAAKTAGETLAIAIDAFLAKKSTFTSTTTKMA